MSAVELLLRNPEGEVLDYTWTASASSRTDDAVVVIGHGVTANKDRAWAVALAAALAEAGWDPLRFSFSGNGDSEGRFEDSCPSKEVADLGAVLDALPNRPIVYVGHSMGGAVGVLRAATDARIRRLVSLAGMVDTADFARRKFGHQQPGDLMWDKPECPLSERFLTDMRQVGSVEPLAARLAVPWLLVHGTADSVVPPEESERLAAQAPDSRTLCLLPDVNHVFSGAGEGPMCAAVVAWLLESGSTVA